MKHPSKQAVWETKNYYLHAHRGSLDVSHPGMELLFRLASGKKNILDLGCGDGTRLAQVALEAKGTGVDISTTAISLAKNQFPRLTFIVSDLAQLPFKTGSFDLAYSAYVLEHTTEPEKVLAEARRILIRGGDLVLICPNYGSPNRASPPFQGSRAKKLLVGYLTDLFRLVTQIHGLHWHNVEPLSTRDDYHIDWDTTVEPYSLTLEKYLERIGFRVLKNIPTWQYELANAKLHQKLFGLLGRLGVYPFAYWSPHIVIHAVKL